MSQRQPHLNYHNPNLYQWKRFSSQKTSGSHDRVSRNGPVNDKNAKEDDIMDWLKKVETATDVAVQKTFGKSGTESTSGRKRYSSHHGDEILKTVSLLHDDEDAHSEAQELVTNWMNEKIRYDFLEDEDMLNDVHDELRDDPSKISGVESATHEKWYEDSETFIQHYLDANSKKSATDSRKKTKPNDVLGQLDIYEADENMVVEALMKNMMEKPLIKPSTMKVLKNRNETSRRKFANSKDPKTTMDMRHKEVKESRIRRQKEEEKRRQQRMIQKEAKFKAQQILKEEELQKKLKEKQEEEAIQSEMTKLRREMTEQKKREEKKRKENEKEYEKAQFAENQDQSRRRQELERSEREKQKEKIMSEISRLEEKQQKVAEVMKKRNMENRKLVRECFSTWCKVVLNQRVKLGKAKAMSDWKYMQKVWSAWKFYTRNQKLDVEAKYHQANVRETRLKEKRAINCEKYRLLRKCFITWKVWVNTEQERKEILKQQQTTKAKMQALLDAVASGNVGDNVQDQQEVILQSVDSNDAVEELPPFKQQKTKIISKTSKSAQKSGHSKTSAPKMAWQVTRKDVHRLKPEEIEHLSSHSQSPKFHQQTTLVPTYDPYENRHKFQKEVIDQQKAILQEQKRMIEEMQEQQRIHALQQEVAVLQQQKKKLESNGSVINQQPKDDAKTLQNSALESKQPLSARSVSTVGTSASKKHPIVSKMEERAAERMKRRKELEEIKRKREEERIKRLQEQEEEKQREEQERKRTEMEERREAKRQQKKLEDEKRATQERMRELCKMADNHYLKSLLKNQGLFPWKELLRSMKNKQEVAAYHYRSVLLRKALTEWNIECKKLKTEREQKADQLYRVILMRRGIRSWKKYGERMEILEQKAIIHRNKVLKKQYLKLWVDYTTDEKLSEWDKEARADEHNRVRQLRRVFNVIRSYRSLVVRETERRKRLEEMRRKVTQLLPDFQYSNESFNADVLEDDDDDDRIS